MNTYLQTAQNIRTGTWSLRWEKNIEDLHAVLVGLIVKLSPCNSPWVGKGPPNVNPYFDFAEAGYR